MRVFVIPTTSSSIQYWRLQSFVEAAWRTKVASFQNSLWEKNIKNEIHPWQERLTDGPKYDPMYIRALVPTIESGCQQADAIVFQMVHLEGALELFDAIKIKFPNTPIFTEIDDNVLSIPSYNQAFDTYNPRSEVRRRVVEQIRKSDGVIVSTPYLKEVYSEFNGNIHVIQNSVDFKKWDRLKKKSKPGIRIGWAGGAGHGGDFEAVIPAIKRIAQNYDVKFIFINGPTGTGLPDSLKGVKNVEYKMRWEPILKYPQLLADQDFDIGIAPLVDSAFNRGKSNLKWLENAALSIPTVASNVGHFKETLTHGVDCMLANDEVEFEKHLISLITNRKLRSAIGRQARIKAEKDFNIDQVVKIYCEALKTRKEAVA